MNFPYKAALGSILFALIAACGAEPQVQPWDDLPPVDWNNEAVKDNLKTLLETTDVKALAAAAEKDDLVAMRYMAVAYLHGVGGVDKKRDKAMRLLGRACEVNDVQACTLLATGQALAEELEERELGLIGLEEICDKGHGPACFMRGALIFAAANPSKRQAIEDRPYETINESMELFRKGCEYGLGRSCLMFSMANPLRQTPFTKEDVVNMFTTACEPKHTDYSELEDTDLDRLCTSLEKLQAEETSPT